MHEKLLFNTDTSLTEQESAKRPASKHANTYDVIASLKDKRQYGTMQNWLVGRLAFNGAFKVISCLYSNNKW